MCTVAILLNNRGIPAVLPMSGSPTFDTEKKQRGEFITPSRPTGRRGNDCRLVTNY